MGMVDNPSAGKFDAPPGAERFEVPKPGPRRAWAGGVLLVAFIAARESLHWLHPRGYYGLAVGAAMIVLFAAHHALRSKLQPGEKDTPYSEPPNITR